MFYPDIFVSKDSLLYRMFVHACMRNNSTVVPSSLLSDCLIAVSGNNISLRLQSKLMLAVVNSLFIHYKLTLSNVMRVLSSGPSSAAGSSSSRISSQVTYSFNIDVLCDSISNPVRECTDEIENVRGRSSSASGYTSMQTIMNNTGMNSPLGSVDLFSTGNLQTGGEIGNPVKRIKLDKNIDVSRETISKKEKAPCEKWSTGLINALLSEEYSEIIGDISSIEAVRRVSSDRSLDRSLLVDRIYDNTIEDVYPVNPKIVEFMSILQGVTEGSISAVQSAPYGRITRIE